MDIIDRGAAAIARGVREREVGALEVARAFLDRIERHNPALNAFITVTRSLAEGQARSTDARIARGEPAGPLAGVPIAIKDNLAVRGQPTTCGSRILEGFHPIYDATAVERLVAAGCTVLGKTNMDEFAMGSSSEHSAFGPVSNPWDLDRVPGGSSGGSAAAVADGLAPVALGSDTGGSIRQPAALCGVVGLKPTYGAVSRYGLVAFASSLDQIGPLARTVEDVALIYRAIAGRDLRDATSVEVRLEGIEETMHREISGLTVGIVREMIGEGIGESTRQAVMRAVEVLGRLGARVTEVSLPHMGHAVPTYYILASAEASSNLARYDGVRYGPRPKTDGDLVTLFKKVREVGFGAEVKRRIMLGTFVLSSGYHEAYYARAQRVRTLIRRDFEAALGRFDVLVGPTSPTPAFMKGEKEASPLQMYLSDICTLSVNLAGLPGLSVPCGTSPEGLPIGLQVIGRAFAEATVLRVGYNYGLATDHHTRRPPPRESRP